MGLGLRGHLDLRPADGDGRIGRHRRSRERDGGGTAGIPCPGGAADRGADQQERAAACCRVRVRRVRGLSQVPVVRGVDTPRGSEVQALRVGAGTGASRRVLEEPDMTPPTWGMPVFSHDTGCPDIFTWVAAPSGFPPASYTPLGRVCRAIERFFPKQYLAP